MAERKARKPMTEEQLERLALAREKANQMRKVNQAKRLQTKMNNLSVNPDGTPKVQPTEPEEQLPEEQLKENVEEKPLKEEPKEETPEEEPEKEVIIKKKAKKKKQMVIVEQSSSDSDEFESCLLYTSPSPRDGLLSRMPSSA